MPANPSHHPYSTELRQRAVHLRELAASIERSLVMALPDVVEQASWTTRRARLCEQMLEANLRQLHQAAEDLRTTAFRFRQRAAQFDRAHRSAA